MKKLLLTLSAALVVALVAYADGPSPGVQRVTVQPPLVNVGSALLPNIALDASLVTAVDGGYVDLISAQTNIKGDKGFAQNVGVDAGLIVQNHVVGERFISTSSAAGTDEDGGANFSCPNNPGSTSPCLSNPNGPTEIWARDLGLPDGGHSSAGGVYLMSTVSFACNQGTLLHVGYRVLGGADVMQLVTTCSGDAEIGGTVFAGLTTSPGRFYSWAGDAYFGAAQGSGGTFIAFADGHLGLYAPGLAATVGAGTSTDVCTAANGLCGSGAVDGGYVDLVTAQTIPTAAPKTWLGDAGFARNVTVGGDAGVLNDFYVAGDESVGGSATAGTVVAGVLTGTGGSGGVLPLAGSMYLATNKAIYWNGSTETKYTSWNGFAVETGGNVQFDDDAGFARNVTVGGTLTIGTGVAASSTNGQAGGNIEGLFPGSSTTHGVNKIVCTRLQHPITAGGGRITYNFFSSTGVTGGTMDLDLVDSTSSTTLCSFTAISCNQSLNASSSHSCSGGIAAAASGDDVCFNADTTNCTGSDDPVFTARQEW